MPTITSRHRFLVFGAVAATVYVVAFGLAGALDRLDRPDALATGVTLDLVLTVPLLWYLLVVRRRLAPVMTVVPVALVGLFAAAAMLPDQHHHAVRVVETVVVPLELGVLGWIVHRAVRAARSVAGDAVAEPMVRYLQAARRLIGARRAAAMVATELTMFHYALAAWRSRPHGTPGARRFTYHIRSGLPGLAFGLAFLLVAEGLALHLWIHTWSPTLAWILSLSNVYALVLIVGDARAAILRPTLVDATTATIRVGLRWTLEVPRHRVVDVVRTAPEGPRQNLMMLGEPTTWIVFDGPVELRGMYGSRRHVRAVGLTPDDGDGLGRALLDD